MTGMEGMGGAPGWLDAVLLAWFAATMLATVHVAFEAFTRNPEMKVMKWG